MTSFSLPVVLLPFCLLVCLLHSITLAQPTVRVRATCEIRSELIVVPKGVQVKGQLQDNLGSPLPNQTIKVAIARKNRPQFESELATLTDATGRFEVDIKLSPGSYRVHADFNGDAFHSPSRSVQHFTLPSFEKTQRTEIPEATQGIIATHPDTSLVTSGSSFSPYWLLIPITICAFLVFILRRRDSNLERIYPIADNKSQVAGIEAAMTTRLTRAIYRKVGGTIRDLENGEPIKHARIHLNSDRSIQLELSVSEVASFISSDLDEGRWEMRVAAHGYADVRTILQIPHRGEWTNTRVRMESLRLLAIKPYRSLALTNLLPSARLWDLWTPRETLLNRRKREISPPALEKLTWLVEAASYDRPFPTEEKIEEIKKQTAEVLETLNQTKNPRQN